MTSQKWFEDINFWSDMETKIYPRERSAAARDEAIDALDLVDCRSQASILDLCCGNGRHAIEFAKLGHTVTGVDLNEYYLSRARISAADNALDIEFVRQDIRTFRRKRQYEFAFILWNAFGYFENDEEDIISLKNAFYSLKPGGKLLIQTHGKETTARKFVRKDWFEFDDGFVLDQRWIEGNWSKMRTRYVMLNRTGWKNYFMSCRLYSPSDLTRLLQAADFKNITCYGNLKGAPYDEKAFELVAIGIK